MEAAQYVLVDENATQEQVDAALQAVTDSRKALVRIVGLSIVPSAGTISPIVTDAVYDYTMSVGNSTSEIRFTVNFLPEATMTINGNPVEKGQASDAIFLGVGRNEITIVITEENGNTRTYTITVTRAASPSSGDSGGGNNNSGSGNAGSPSASPGPVTTTIEVDVVIGGDEEADITKVPIERTKNRNGSIADKVIFTKDKAQETVDKALKSGKDIARILIPDEADEVSQVNLEIPADTVNLLKGKGIALEIYNPNVFIQVPADSLNGLDQSFYFRLVPVKDRSEREDIELRAKTEEAVRKWAADGNIEVVARPMTIETNLPSRPVTLTLPLRGVALPEKAGERAAFLAQLGIFIEHTNGEKEVIPGNPVVMPDGQLGLQFSIDHFSTFYDHRLQPASIGRSAHAICSRFSGGAIQTAGEGDARTTGGDDRTESGIRGRLLERGGSVQGRAGDLLVGRRDRLRSRTGDHARHAGRNLQAEPSRYPRGNRDSDGQLPRVDRCARRSKRVYRHR
ncbi:hypothetical protein HMSSN139_08720 [Paenibacillus sp. HMSSN-139]|nr:hypothetical protein HMSSN139_08720 [Paenibacillus sp. HMSSN-139]